MQKASINCENNDYEECDEMIYDYWIKKFKAELERTGMSLDEIRIIISDAKHSEQSWNRQEELYHLINALDD